MATGSGAGDHGYFVQLMAGRGAGGYQPGGGGRRVALRIFAST